MKSTKRTRTMEEQGTKHRIMKQPKMRTTSKKAKKDTKERYLDKNFWMI